MSLAGNIEGINKKLQQEEEWLKQFESNVKKSAQVKESIEEIIGKFHSRLVSLEQNVLPMHEVNGQLQVKQHNIQRLINTIDATIQFYGRTSELESSIRDGVPNHNMKTYLDQMDYLQQAINFFQTQSNYQTKCENMKMTLESGFTMLEREYRSVLQRNTIQADAAVLIDSLDDQYELMGNRVKDIKTVKNLEEVVTLGVWLLNCGRSRFLRQYSEIRGDNMLRAVAAVAQHHKALTAKLHSKSVVLKTALKRAGKGEKGDKKEPELGGHNEEGALLMFGCLLALLEVEDCIMQKAIPDTSQRAQVFRDVVAKPMSFVVRHVDKIVQENTGGVIALLPLLRFLTAHQTRLANLASNSSGDIPFEGLVRNTRMAASAGITEKVAALQSDTNKFTPSDGNVHSLTPSTMDFLVALTMHRQTVTQQVLSMTAGPGEKESTLLKKLFARVLRALGDALKKTAQNYEDPALAQVFLLNNYYYIANSLTDEVDTLLPVMSEQNTSLFQFYRAEIAQCLGIYIRSWNPALAVLQGVERAGEDRIVARNMAAAFASEFEKVYDSQRNYCVADASLAAEIQEKIREAMLPSYRRLTDRLRDLSGQLKYTEDQLSTIIDRLFDHSA